jgi:peptidyl-prolyl cis-trans isomerase C
MRRTATLAVVAAAILTAHGSSGADDAARRATVVAKIGERTLTVGELEDRILGVPRYQLASFGADNETIRKRFLNEVVLPEILLASGAEKRKLDRELPASHQIERAKSQATLRAVRAQVGPAAQIAMADVQKFYDENRSKFDAPERVNVWRIACKTKEEADQVLEAAKKEPTPKAFEKLAREHSLDKGTYLRGGNLGFLMPDGTSNEAGLKVDPVIPKAASEVKNGDFVPQPVKEGESWSVVWRRGSIGASKRTVEDAAAQIRDTLWKQRVETASKKLEDDLRAKKVSDVNYDLLTMVDVPAGEPIVNRKRPGQVAPNQSSPPASPK